MHLCRSLLFWTWKHINTRLICMSVDYYRYKTYMTTFYILAVSTGFLLWIAEIHVYILKSFIFLRSNFSINMKFNYSNKTHNEHSTRLQCAVQHITMQDFLVFMLRRRRRERSWNSPWRNKAYKRYNCLQC